MLTPREVHYGAFEQTLNQRSIVLMNAYLEHPERFVRGVPAVQPVPTEVWINKPNVKEPIAKTVS